MTKTEKIRKTIWVISLIILGISLLCPTYCTNVSCSGPLSGLADLLFGWFAALFMGSTYSAWFANPFFITAIFTNKKVPVLSLIFSVIALFIALTFLKGGTVWLNEAGHKGYITKLQSGYWLWVSSMVIMVIAALVPIIQRIKNFFRKDNNTN
ncbi:hypothetical protein [uncultured Fluviicola sp.]|uniref:hypothetical protein n=1 Tax=uncultured Fluviicola sp. TaxID=463303 RepID=UPI0025DBA299|nr:hypothetical protein [uncultured Fluviicola sp.]